MKRPEQYDDDVADALEKYFRRSAQGKENAKHGAQIVSDVPAVRNWRQCADYIEYLRRHRLLLIASDTQRGYWLCENVPDFREFYRTYRGRAMEILTTCQALERKHPALLTEPMDFEGETDG